MIIPKLNRSLQNWWVLRRGLNKKVVEFWRRQLLENDEGHLSFAPQILKRATEKNRISHHTHTQKKGSYFKGGAEKLTFFLFSFGARTIGKRHDSISRVWVPVLTNEHDSIELNVRRQKDERGGWW